MPSNDSVVQRFWTRAFRNPEAPALLVRNPKPEPVLLGPIVTPHMGMGGGLNVYTPPPFLDLSAGHTALAVSTVTAYLRKSGFAKGDRAAVMAWNCPEWIIADLAIQSLGGVTVPIYPHSTPDQVNYVLRDSGARFLFSNEREQLGKVDTTSGCTTVHFDDLPFALTSFVPSAAKPFMEWFLAGDGLKNLHPSLWNLTSQEAWNVGFLRLDITADDIATIIYTSGSTGVPKGVVLTHGAFAAACAGMLAHGFNIEPGRDVYLSYLPLAHVYERACGAYLCLWTGVAMAFCKVEDVGETLKLVRPTLVHGVPAVWRKIKDKVDANLAAATGIKAKLIKWAFQPVHSNFGHWLADVLVFSKIRNELGGRLRICTSGGAPISPEILRFYQSVGINVLQGYGLTESTGASAVNKPDGCDDDICNKVGSVGKVIGSLQCRIAPLPGQEDSGEGEIQFFGPTIMKGYWNRPEETAKTFTEDGWFKTGDRGRIDADGFLYITGRIKRLLKTDGGKYVAPDKIEKAFETTPVVQYVVPVGDGMPFISGFIFVNQVLAKELLSKAGISLPENTDVATFYASHPLIIEAVGAAKEQANTKLERWEQLKKIHIIPVEATIAAGLLTPTLKIRTEEVLTRYAAELAEFYRKPKA